jgi:hypothetical protein
MIPEGYAESLAEALGFDFDIPSDGTSMWMFEIGDLQFDFALMVMNKSQKNKTELRPYAAFMCALLYWESMEDVAEEVLIEEAKSNHFPFGLRLRDLEDGGVMLYLEHFALLTLGIDQDADSLKVLVDMMAGVAGDIQKDYI